MSQNGDTQNLNDMTILHDGDILFECPYCGKSMAIDGAGAGLMVPCAGCGKQVQVPIPDPSASQVPAPPPSAMMAPGSDDATTIRQLDSALAIANQQIDRLSNEKEALQERRAFLEQIRIAHSTRMEQIANELVTMQACMSRIHVLLNEAKAERPL